MRLQLRPTTQARFAADDVFRLSLRVLPGLPGTATVDGISGAADTGKLLLKSATPADARLVLELGTAALEDADDLRDRATHTGTQAISTVAGLQTALDAKAAVGHGHDIADVSGLQTALDAKLDDTQASTFGLSLLDDANASAARTTLGLGTVATTASTDYAPAGHVGATGTAHGAATTSVAGFMSSADKTKLNGVATGATANSTDASLRDRSTHTGTQLAATISDLTAAIAARTVFRRLSGGDPTGAADSSAAFAAEVAAGGVCVVPKGTYKLTAQVNVTGRAVFLFEDGVTINVTHDNAGFNITASNVTFQALGRVVINGPRTAAKEHAFTSRAFTVAGALASRISNVRIDGFAMQTFKYGGVRADYVDDLDVVNCEVDACTYCGILGISVNRFRFNDNEVRNIEPGNGGIAPKLNAYGIGATVNVSTDPASSFGHICGNIVANVPTWAGIDTHGGAGLLIERNQVSGCRIGLDITISSPVAPKNISIKGNQVYGLSTSASPPPGPLLVVAGASGGDFANRVVVDGNLFFGGGWWDGTTLDHSVSIQQVSSLAFTGNVIENSNARALGFFYQCYGVVCTGNMFHNVAPAGGTTLAFIDVNTVNFYGLISGNTFLVSNSETTYCFNFAAQAAGWQIQMGRDNAILNATAYTAGSQANRIDLGASVA